jgi:LuxR family maltose regulon positive regulatory protein
LRTSFVDRVNGELADLLAGRSGSERTLLALEDANAFVVSLDPQRTWFRYHHLLADFLRLELRRRSADEVPDLHRRAARWLADHGEAVEAVRHTLAAGDWPDAARMLADHLFSLTLDGQEGTIAALLRSFPAGVSADDPELGLAHAAVALAQGRLEEAAAQLALAEFHVQSAPPPRRRRLAVATASLRLALARRSGQFAEVMEQVNLLDASIGDRSWPRELRGVALMNLGIVERWSRRFDDAERHLSEGASLAQAIDRPYLEVACRAHQVFPTTLVSLASARERGRQAEALAERYGLGDRPILAPALGALAFWAIWMGEFDEGESALRRAWEVAEPQIDPAAAVQLHMVTGQLHSARGQHQAALEAFAAGAQAQSLLTGADAFATPVVAWLAATQARLGMPDEARETLAGFSAEPDRMGFVRNARAVICLADGDPAGALDVLQDVPDFTPPAGPAFTLVERYLLAGIAHLHMGDRNAAAAAAEAALSAAEPDRLIFPFAMTGAAELLEALPRHETAHGALLADIVDLLRGAPAPSAEGGLLLPPEALSPSELRVLRYLPTNLTRPEIARELYVSVHTVNTHIRNIYLKLGARDRASAIRRARELRLLSTGRH